MIEVREVSKSLKNSNILKDINLSLYKGKIYGIKGINGSGKTMLLRVICGLLIPDKGSVMIDSKELHKVISFPPSVGAVIEMPEFLPQFTGRKNLEILAGINNKIDDNAIIQSLKVVGLDPNDRRKYRKYSLGMKQRLSIAQAIMESPDLLILDEPTNALDQNTITGLTQFLLDYKTKGKCIIVSSHDFQFLETISDEIFHIENGKIINHSIIKFNTKTVLK
ncbi:ATP-binding cassette domain-containing protein [Margalitia sp. FSL K6-0131]|uniref:ATP-binding cassette domain-containing protein n=1 Tax=Margalitia sp. FSL K6-0131 TaxID=2954604 RepID=UPI0030F5FDE8